MWLGNHLHRGVTLEREGGQVGLQRQPVVLGHHVRGQALKLGLAGCCGHFVFTCFAHVTAVDGGEGAAVATLCLSSTAGHGSGTVSVTPVHNRTHHCGPHTG
uniref:Uncharacterized protein n=1 Tax=Anopheles merus TaxID=30066 RepID=A0A182VN83_ANOME